MLRPSCGISLKGTVAKAAALSLSDEETQEASFWIGDLLESTRSLWPLGIPSTHSGCVAGWGERLAFTRRGSDRVGPYLGDVLDGRLRCFTMRLTFAVSTTSAPSAVTMPHQGDEQRAR